MLRIPEFAARCAHRLVRFEDGHRPLDGADVAAHSGRLVTLLRAPAERTASGFLHGMHDCVGALPASLNVSYEGWPDGALDALFADGPAAEGRLARWRLGGDSATGGGAYS